MKRKIPVLTSKFMGWRMKNKEPQSRILPTRNAISYMKDGISATVEWCEKKFSEK